MKRLFCAISGVAIVVLAAALCTSADDKKAISAIEVRIVPTNHREDGRAIDVTGGKHFHVVITNVSDTPVRLWQEWCSWGHDNLSFQVTDENGKTWIVKKQEMGWDENWPDWKLIPPREHMVFDVSLDKETWQDSPLPGKPNPVKLKMKAIYEVAADDDSKQHKVWTGKATSPDDTYTIYH